MDTWVRVFSLEEACPDESLVGRAVFGREDGVWFWAEVDGIRVERFLATEDGIRAELNAWAAIVEETVDEPGPLMERIIQSRQIFTLIGPVPATETLALSLARATRGIVQIDNAGWRAADGAVLVEGEEDGGES
jgi:hypothetical protein